MQLAELVDVSRRVAETRSRTRKIAVLSECVTAATQDELRLAVAYLAGTLPQGRVGIGYAAVYAIPTEAAAEPQLQISDVDDLLQRIAAATGAGSRERRSTLLHDLFARATADEQAFLRRLLLGEMRHGALDGVMVETIAAAAQVPAAAVRRAYMLSDDLAAVAATALKAPSVDRAIEALARFRMQVGRPVQPMLARTAADIAVALGEMGPDGGPATAAVIETKIDGARVQVHRRGDTVTVYSRSLRDITIEAPSIVDVVRRFPDQTLILDGETVSLRSDGRPAPFQITMRNLGVPIAADAPTTVRFFDCLHRDGVDLLDEPLERRLSELVAAVPAAWIITREQVSTAAAAHAFMERVLAEGHEGVMVKDLASPYEAGRRGAAWRKVKPSHTLDLVVLAVEWGSGRREGWLSNLHLGARDPHGGFVMLGKPFKGLSDAMLRWQTDRLLQLETSRRGHVVYVEPQLVVEIAFDGVQASTRYPGGMALRFARVKRYRDDKTADQADTIGQVRAIHRGARDVGTSG